MKQLFNGLPVPCKLTGAKTSMRFPLRKVYSMSNCITKAIVQQCTEYRDSKCRTKNKFNEQNLELCEKYKVTGDNVINLISTPAMAVKFRIFSPSHRLKIIQN